MFTFILTTNKKCSRGKHDGKNKFHFVDVIFLFYLHEQYMENREKLPELTIAKKSFFFI